MKQLVIMPGGFHPFHAGHAALYNSARQAFPSADVYVAATNDTSTRPFPFEIKEKLAQLAGVNKGRFMRVKSPFRAEEITAPYDPNTTQLIFVRSDKDTQSQPRPGGVKKDGTPSYLQPYNKSSDQPMSQHAYMAYLPTVEFGPGMTSATEIRGAWPKLNEKRKTALVMSLYPQTQTNPKLAATVVKMLDTAMGTLDEANGPPGQQGAGMTAGYQRRENQPVAEGDVVPFARPVQQLTWQQVPRDILLLANDWFWASEDNSGLDATIDPTGYGNGTANDVRYITAKLQQKGWTIDFNDENDGIDEYNLVLTNRRGQKVLLSIDDAQSFTGWAANTNPVNENQGWAATLEEDNDRVLDLTKNFPAHSRVHARVTDVLPSGKVKLQVTVADTAPGKKPTVKVGQLLSMAMNYLRSAPQVNEDGFGRNVYFQVPTEKLPLAQAVKQSINFHPTNKNGVWKFSIMKNQRPDSVQGIIGKLEQMFGSRVNIDSLEEALKPDAFNALQQAKKNIEQNRQQEIDQWAQDFRANSAKLAGQQLKRAIAPPPVPVAQPGEKHAVLKSRITQLDQAIKKQQQLDALTQKLEYKGLLTPAMQQDFDTRMYVRDAAADNYQALNQKLDRAIELATNRLRTNKLAFRENADYIEESKR